ncbi:MAG: enoyl-CoA hydratase/isomerase family protein [Micrococcus sp.]|nr:enoyl-CoA hydratase/isomerase family protein [Micrococcus sp.]
MTTETPPAQPAEPEVIVRRAGHLGHLILNRPRALNAITPAMVDTVREALAAWREDDGVRTVLVSGAGERGLCAGGDIVNLHRTVTEGHPEGADEFFDIEYTMNGEIADYPKPFVAFMDGIVLGGGVGISAHGSHRVVTERTRLGMPETGIGFFPDVGGSWLLSRAPSGFGTHMALTSQHVTGADALALGFADHFVPSDALADLSRALETREADEAIAAVATAAPPAPLLEHRRWIESAYAAATAEEIVSALEAAGDPAAAEAAAQIRAKSPTSVKVTLELVRRAARMASVHEVLDQDRRVAYHLIRSDDMSEGIRAQLVDKDRNPRWNPASLDEVRDEDVAAVFAPSDTDQPTRTQAVKEALS